MLERLLIVTVLFTLGFAAYIAYTRYQMRRISSLDADPIRQRLTPGIPAIVYFTTPGCLPCKTQQQPALMTLTHLLGESQLQIIQIDASEEAATAERWGVMTAPTTFIIDRDGRTKAINHGVADAGKLQRQIST